VKQINRLNLGPRSIMYVTSFPCTMYPFIASFLESRSFTLLGQFMLKSAVVCHTLARLVLGHIK
jgi:hypothetical protein